MTYKHKKPSESLVIRELEKMAIKKGMVKPQKKEEEKEDFGVDNLVNNLMRLCDGLRNKGLGKYADELQTKYMEYKKAAALYETSKEKGEDIINEAHPGGSTKLDVEGDGVIETILDQHSKMMKSVEKKPTGKLSEAREIIEAVKIALGREIDSNTKNILLGINNILSLILNILTSERNYTKYTKPLAINITNYIEYSQNITDFTKDVIEELRGRMFNIKQKSNIPSGILEKKDDTYINTELVRVDNLFNQLLARLRITDPNAMSSAIFHGEMASQERIDPNKVTKLLDEYFAAIDKYLLKYKDVKLTDKKKIDIIEKVKNQRAKLVIIYDKVDNYRSHIPMTDFKDIINSAKFMIRFNTYDDFEKIIKGEITKYSR